MCRPVFGNGRPSFSQAMTARGLALVLQMRVAVDCLATVSIVGTPIIDGRTTGFVCAYRR